MNKGIEKPGVQFNPNQLSNIKQLRPDLSLPLMINNIFKTDRGGERRGEEGEREEGERRGETRGGEGGRGEGERGERRGRGEGERGGEEGGGGGKGWG